MNDDDVEIRSKGYSLNLKYESYSFTGTERQYRTVYVSSYAGIRSHNRRKKESERPCLTGKNTDYRGKTFIKFHKFGFSKILRPPSLTGKSLINYSDATMSD